MIALQVPCLGSHIVDNGRGFGRTRRITPICQVNVEEGVSSKTRHPLELPSQLCLEMMNTFKSLLSTNKFYFCEARKATLFQ